jgi:hypothetical protein
VSGESNFENKRFNIEKPNIVFPQTEALLKSILAEEAEVWMMRDDASEKAISDAEKARQNETKEERFEKINQAAMVAAVGLKRIEETLEYKYAINAYEEENTPGHPVDKDLINKVAYLSNLKEVLSLEAEMLRPEENSGEAA